MSSSQVSSQGSTHLHVVLPVVKFSHSTLPFGTRNNQWSHVVRNDIQFIVQDVTVQLDSGRYEQQTIMKITAGGNILEAQDLRQLEQHVREFDPVSGADPPVQTVVKCPFFAMRYPKSIHTLRRLQVKFRNDQDCNTIVNIFADLQFPITNNALNPKINNHPSTSPAIPISSSTSLISTSGRVSLPPAASRRPPFEGLSSPNMLGPYQQETTSTFKVPARPDTASSGLYRSSSPLSAFTRPHSASSMPLAPLLTSNNPRLDSTNMLKRPSSSNLYLAQVEREAMNQEHETAQVSSPHHDTPAPSNLHLLSRTQTESNRQTGVVQGMLDGLSARQDITSPFFPAQNESVPMRRASFEPPSQLDRSSVSHGESRRLNTDFLQRPASTPSAYTLPDPWLPPKRTLPFPKRGEPTRSRSSIVADLSPLPKPTPVNQGASNIKGDRPISNSASTPETKPTKRTACYKITTAKTSKNASEEISPPDAPLPPSSRTVQEETSPLAAKSAAAKSKSSSGLQSKAILPPKRVSPAESVPPPQGVKRVKMVDQGTQTAPISDGLDAPLIPLASESARAEALSLSRPISPPENFLNELDSFVTRHRARPAPKEIWDVQGYSEMDEEQRHVLLNNFICENLENEDFLALCQDTENAWRRIGLGM